MNKYTKRAEDYWRNKFGYKLQLFHATEFDTHTENFWDKLKEFEDEHC